MAPPDTFFDYFDRLTASGNLFSHLSIFCSISCVLFLIFQVLDLPFSVHQVSFHRLESERHYHWLFGFTNFPAEWFRRPSWFFSESTYAAIFMGYFALVFLWQAQNYWFALINILGVISTGSVAAVIALMFIFALRFCQRFSAFLSVFVVFALALVLYVIALFVSINDGTTLSRLFGNRFHSIEAKFSWLQQSQMLPYGVFGNSGIL